MSDQEAKRLPRYGVNTSDENSPALVSRQPQTFTAGSYSSSPVTGIPRAPFPDASSRSTTSRTVLRDLDPFSPSTRGTTPNTSSRNKPTDEQVRIELQNLQNDINRPIPLSEATLRKKIDGIIMLHNLVAGRNATLTRSLHQAQQRIRSMKEKQQTRSSDLAKLNAIVEERNQAVKDMSMKVQAAAVRDEEQRATIKRLDGELRELRLSPSASESEAKLREAYNSIFQQNADLQKTLHSRDITISNQAAELDRCKRDIDRLSKLGRGREILSQKSLLLEQQNKELQQQLEDLQEEYKQRLQDKDRTIERLRNDFAAVQERLKSSDDPNTFSLQDQLQKEQELSRQLAGRVADLEQELESRNESFGKALKSNDDQMLEAERLQNTIDAQSAKISELESEVDSLRKELRIATESKAAAVRDAELSHSKLMDVAANLANVKGQMEGERRVLEREHNRIVSASEASNAQNKSLQADVRGLREQLSSKSREITDLTDKLTDAQAKLRAAREREEEAVKSASDIQAELTKQIALYHEYRDRCRDIEAQNAALTKQLNDLLAKRGDKFIHTAHPSAPRLSENATEAQIRALEQEIQRSRALEEKQAVIDSIVDGMQSDGELAQNVAASVRESLNPELERISEQMDAVTSAVQDINNLREQLATESEEKRRLQDQVEQERRLREKAEQEVQTHSDAATDTNVDAETLNRTLDAGEVRITTQSDSPSHSQEAGFLGDSVSERLDGKNMEEIRGALANIEQLLHAVHGRKRIHTSTSHTSDLSHYSVIGSHPFSTRPNSTVGREATVSSFGSPSRLRSRQRSMQSEPVPSSRPARLFVEAPNEANDMPISPVTPLPEGDEGAASDPDTSQPEAFKRVAPKFHTIDEQHAHRVMPNRLSPSKTDAAIPIRRRRVSSGDDAVQVRRKAGFPNTPPRHHVQRSISTRSESLHNRGNTAKRLPIRHEHENSLSIVSPTSRSSYFEEPRQAITEKVGGSIDSLHMVTVDKKETENFNGSDTSSSENPWTDDEHSIVIEDNPVSLTAIYDELQQLKEVIAGLRQQPTAAPTSHQQILAAITESREGLQQTIHDECEQTRAELAAADLTPHSDPALQEKLHEIRELLSHSLDSHDAEDPHANEVDQKLNEIKSLLADSLTASDGDGHLSEELSAAQKHQEELAKELHEVKQILVTSLQHHEAAPEPVIPDHVAEQLHDIKSLLTESLPSVKSSNDDVVSALHSVLDGMKTEHHEHHPEMPLDLAEAMADIKELLQERKDALEQTENDRLHEHILTEEEKQREEETHAQQAADLEQKLLDIRELVNATLHGEEQLADEVRSQLAELRGVLGELRTERLAATSTTPEPDRAPLEDLPESFYERLQDMLQKAVDAGDHVPSHLSDRLNDIQDKLSRTLEAQTQAQASNAGDKSTSTPALPPNFYADLHDMLKEVLAESVQNAESKTDSKVPEEVFHKLHDIREMLSRYYEADANKQQQQQATDSAVLDKLNQLQDLLVQSVRLQQAGRRQGSDMSVSRVSVSPPVEMKDMLDEISSHVSDTVSMDLSTLTSQLATMQNQISLMFMSKDEPDSDSEETPDASGPTVMEQLVMVGAWVAAVSFVVGISMLEPNSDAVLYPA